MYFRRMKIFLKFIFLFIVLSAVSCSKNGVITVGFYNVENLFDTIDDPNTFDGEFLPDSAKAWNTDKYNTKLLNLSTVISDLNGGTPDFLGLCEIENKLVIQDLIKTPLLRTAKYKIIHEESSDLRGIDVGAIYNPKVFKYIEHGMEKIDLSEFQQITRDILWVKLEAKQTQENFYFLVNHWPSRRGGLEESEPKRIKAAQTLAALSARLIKEDPTANIVIMGDFNDEPSSHSLQTVASETSNAQLFNLMADLEKNGKGSYCYRDDWNMLDQIIINSNLQDNKTWRYVANSVQIKDNEALRQHSEKYEGYPLRTFGGRNYLAGYSDHFAVSIQLRYSLH
jgi:predicted extracellular nuclease